MKSFHILMCLELAAIGWICGAEGSTFTAGIKSISFIREDEREIAQMESSDDRFDAVVHCMPNPTEMSVREKGPNIASLEKFTFSCKEAERKIESCDKALQGSQLLCIRCNFHVFTIAIVLIYLFPPY